MVYGTARLGRIMSLNPSSCRFGLLGKACFLWDLESSLILSHLCSDFNVTSYQLPTIFLDLYQ